MKHLFVLKILSYRVKDCLKLWLYSASIFRKNFEKVSKCLSLNQTIRKSAMLIFLTYTPYVVGRKQFINPKLFK